LQKNKSHIVILTTHFPPVSAVAVNRILAFVKYINKDKFDVSVITIDSENSVSKERKFDSEIYRLKNNLLIPLPKFKNDNKIIHYIKVVWKLVILKCLNNEYYKWTNSTVKKLNEIHKNKPISIILSSFPPVATHISAYKFCVSFPKIKWIVDMRDEMSQNPLWGYKAVKYLRKIEFLINKRADALITVSAPIVDYFKEILPDIKYFEEIRNGFDNDLLPQNHFFNECFTILYAGNFYGDRKPNNFFKAIELLIIENKLPKKWVVQFVGTPKNFDTPNLIIKNIKFINKVPQEECVKLMSKADATLLIQPYIGRKGIYTGKLFDYLSVQKPIIAIVDKSDVAAELIADLNAGFVAEFDDVEDIAKAIGQAIDLWKNKIPLANDKTKVEKIHRKYQVKKLEVLIDKLLEQRNI